MDVFLMYWNDVKITHEMLMNVKCPACGSKKGVMCVYMPSPATSVHSRSPAVIALINRVGTPTKKCHGARSQLVRKQLRTFYYRGRLPKITPPRAEVRETLAIFREYDLREREQLRSWVRRWGLVLLSPAIPSASDHSNDSDGQLDQ